MNFKKLSPALMLGLLVSVPAFGQVSTSSVGGLESTITEIPDQLAQPAHESNCSDRIDEDKDSVTDCADSDCYEDAACKTAGGLENNNVLCSDWLDNDGDGAIDCEDVDCQHAGVSACQGSWKGALSGTGSAQPGGAKSGLPMDVPQLGEGQSFVDLLGKGDDADGERNDFVCSDGMDNDGDGRADCADLGCQFDPAVTVCRGTPGLRFSVAAHAQTSFDFEANEDEGQQPWDTRINRLQLRAFGPIPSIQDSFFLLSMRAETNPRLTFAFFSMPIGGGHYVNINSGGGGLSNLPVLSVSKNPMLDGAFYLTNAFEQGNGAAAEISGPILPGLLDYRVFAGGGSGRFNGNIGGRFFNTDTRNYTWGAGFQMALYVTGRFDRWDTRFLYTPASKALTIYAGARYDQREVERYPWGSVSTLFRWGRFLASADVNVKREINFETTQLAWNALGGFLIIPKYLYMSADIGGFTASEFKNLDLTQALPTDLRRLTDQFQWRVALHAYVWRHQGLITLLYTDNLTESATPDVEDRHRREIRIESQFRF